MAKDHRSNASNQDKQRILNFDSGKARTISELVWDEMRTKFQPTCDRFHSSQSSHIKIDLRRSEFLIRLRRLYLTNFNTMLLLIVRNTFVDVVPFDSNSKGNILRIMCLGLQSPKKIESVGQEALPSGLLVLTLFLECICEVASMS